MLPVFHILRFMLQNSRSTAEMLESLAQGWSAVVWICLFVRLVLFVFEYFYWRVSFFNPGTQIGGGVAGCIGVIGSAWKYWDWTTGVALFLLGSLFGSGMFRFNEPPSDQKYEAMEERMMAFLTGSERRSIKNN